MMSSQVDVGLQKCEKEVATNMKCLPSDVVLDILSRLPVESVLDCKLVCKWVLQLLRDRSNQFAKMHHQQQLLQLASCGDASSSSTGFLFSFERVDEDDETIGPRLYYGDKYNDEMNIHENFSYKTLQKTSVSYPPVVGLEVIVGSCNGLICLNKYRHGVYDPVHICNPNTGEYVNLPEYTLCGKGYEAAYGFGYVHSATNDQYKVVRVFYNNILDEDYGKGEVQVYTIGSGRGWRTIDKTSYQLCWPSPTGTFVDGAIYWIDRQQIVAFNLADEEFRSIPPPPCFNFLHNSFYILKVLRGNLCFCHQRYGDHLLDIWSLKKNTPDASWSKDFSIPYDSAKEIDNDSQLIPLLVTKKNEVLFEDEGVLYCYDPKLAAVRRLWDDDRGEILGVTAFPHMNSFVSLEALGEKSEIKKKLTKKNEVLFQDEDVHPKLTAAQRSWDDAKRALLEVTASPSIVSLKAPGDEMKKKKEVLPRRKKNLISINLSPSVQIRFDSHNRSSVAQSF